MNLNTGQKASMQTKQHRPKKNATKNKNIKRVIVKGIYVYMCLPAHKARSLTHAL